MKLFSNLRVALFTTLNIVLNAATLGRYVWLEGSVRKGVLTNWAKRKSGKGRYPRSRVGGICH
jgi:hypothetical protein